MLPKMSLKALKTPRGEQRGTREKRDDGAATNTAGLTATVEWMTTVKTKFGERSAGTADRRAAGEEKLGLSKSGD